VTLKGQTRDPNTLGA